MPNRHLNPSDEALAALLSRGHGTPQEILTVHFGVWPPPGLDFDPDAMLQEPWIFQQTLFSKPDDLAATEYRILRDSSVVKVFAEHPAIQADIASLSEMPDWVSFMGHEALHTLQGRAFTLDEMLEDGLDPLPESRLQGFGPVLEKLMSKGESSSHRQQRHDALRNQGPDNGGSPFYSLLYMEIQARLHELMATRARTGRPLPADREELTRAWADFFDPSLPLSMSAKYVVTSTVPSLPKSKQAEFFTKVVPDLYGTLLELYGDPQGRTKMGLEPSPVYARKVLHQVVREFFQKEETEPWSAAEWERMTAKVEPEQLAAVLGYAARYDHAEAFAPLLQAYLERAPEPDAAFLKEIAAETDLPQIKESLRRAADALPPSRSPHSLRFPFEGVDFGRPQDYGRDVYEGLEPGRFLF